MASNRRLMPLRWPIVLRTTLKYKGAVKTGPFFYSTNGTDVHGPVADQDLRILVLEERLGRGSFLCHAGESTWFPFNPDAYRPAVAPVRTTRIVPAEMFAKLWTPTGEGVPGAPAATSAAPASVGSESAPVPDSARAPVVAGTLVSPEKPPKIASASPTGPANSASSREIATVVPAPKAAVTEVARPPTVKTPPPDARPGGAGLAPAPGGVLSKSARVAINLSAPAGVLSKTGPPMSPLTPRPAQFRPVAAPSPAEVAKVDGVAHVPPPIPLPVPEAHAASVPAVNAEAAIADEAEPESPRDSRAFAVAFGFVAFLAAIGAALLSGFFAGSAGGTPGGPRRVFTLTLAALTLVPFLLALLIPARTRAIFRASTMAALALGVCVYQLTRPGVNDAVQLALSTPIPALEAPSGPPGGHHVEHTAAAANHDLSPVTLGLQSRIKASTDAERECKFTLENVQGVADLAARNEAFQRLSAAQGEVVTYLQSFDQHWRDALADKGMSPAEQNERVAAERHSEHVEANIELWKARRQLTEDNIARFDYLRRAWGHWQFQNGEIVLADETQLSAYGKLVDAVRDDIARIRAAQAQILR